MENRESLLQLFIEDILGRERIRIEHFTEPLLIIEFFKESEKCDILKKSLCQLLNIIQYKNILLVSQHDLKDLLSGIRDYFQDNNFYFGYRSYTKCPEFYSLSFFSQRKLQYFKIFVDIGQ